MLKLIRIRRGEAPGKLIESGQGELDSMLKLYAEGSAEYETGQAKFFFKRTIFSSTVVRECLRAGSTQEMLLHGSLSGGRTQY